MNAIRRIEIRNFQGHKNLEISVSPTVTVICGPTDSGKSALIRALKWALLNTPPKSGMIRRGSRGAQVSVRIGKRTVVRRKGTVNEYRLDGKRFRAFARSVPAEIANLLNVADINFQGQYDPPFWLSNSAGEVSRALNRIVSLDIIDRTISNLVRISRTVKTEIDVAKDRVWNARAEVQKWRFAKRLAADVSKAEEMDRKRSRAVQRRDRLAELVRDGQNARKRLRTIQAMVADGDNVLAAGDEWRDALEAYSRLAGLVRTVRQAERVAKIEIPDLTEVEKLKAENIWDDYNRLAELVGSVRAAEQQVRRNEERERKLELQIKEMVGDICPVCGTVLKK